MFSPKTRILIVDDMPAMRMLMKQQLSQLGFRDVLEAEDGEIGLKILFEEFFSEKPIELVLSDWNMPKMSGIALLRAVREGQDFPNLPFLLITAENEFAQVKEAVALRVSDYIVKPFTPAVLKSKLSGVWARLPKGDSK